MQYSGWPIARVIESDIRRPTLEAIKAKVGALQQVIIVRLVRDAWQMAARPDIVERLIRDQEHILSELDNRLWSELLREARQCLDEARNFRGRSRQQVTIVKSQEARLMDVSPHLHIGMPLDIEEVDLADGSKLDSRMGVAIES
ncbi:MAG TPA: hypothetical protein VGG79_23300 [Roseiarcus sp.]|jgi:hypothetical protein